MADCLRENENVVRHLFSMFSKNLDFEIIQSIAHSCQFDLQKSTDMLLEITSNISSVNESKPDLSYSNVSRGTIKKPDHSSAAMNFSKTVDKRPTNKSKHSSEVNRVKDLIRDGIKVVVFLRGLPGSGKSTLGREIVTDTIGKSYIKDCVLSADDFFMKRGEYVYDPYRIQDAHAFNQRRCFKAMQNGLSPIIIDNTNTEMWEMKPYAIYATDFSYIIAILEPSTTWAFNVRELFSRNTHNVPKDKIKSMLERYEKNITPEKLLDMYGLQYKFQLPPQYRLFPPINFTNRENVNKTTVDIPALYKGRVEPSAPDKLESTKTDDFCIQNVIDFLNLSSSKPTKLDNNQFSDKKSLLNCEDLTLKAWPTADINSWNPFMKNEIQNSKSECNTIQKSEFKVESSDDKALFNNISPCAEVTSEMNFDQLPPLDRIIKYDDLTLKDWKSFNGTLTWDLTPIPNDMNIVETLNTEHVSIAETKEFGTNTSSKDFLMLSNNEVNEDIKVLYGRNIDINLNSSNIVLPAILKKVMIHKSSMTEQECPSPDISSKTSHIKKLNSFFPNVEINLLNDIYEKCNRDLDWAVELLLEDGKVSLNTNEDIEIECDDSELQSQLEEDEKKPEIVVIKAQEPKDISNPEELDTLTESIREKLEEADEIRKILNEKIEINDEYYSEHVRKIKNLKHRKTFEVPLFDPEQPSTSNSYSENCAANFGDRAFNFDAEADFSGCDSDSSESNASSTDYNTVEFNLGEDFIAQLEQRFGEPGLSYPKGFQPVVQLPVKLARQLYMFYVESVYQQMEVQNEVLDTMVKEDEAFAKKLEEQDGERVVIIPSPKIPDLKEIMQEQASFNAYQKEVDQWKKLTPDDIAAKMTKQKLFDSFPNIDKEQLVEIWQAHGNNYKETVEVLLASTDRDSSLDPHGSIIEPPILEEDVIEMKETQNKIPIQMPDHVQNRCALSYRDEASVYLQNRTELYQKAQKAYQKGMTEVAQFYSELAQKQTKLYDLANHLAATAFLNENSQRLEKIDTIDLHYLYVKEALSALDIFIDENVNTLKSGKKDHLLLFIITGRGKNSYNGKSKIRPAVISRLKTRNIKYHVMNPGLLRIKINKYTAITNNL